MEDGKPDDAVEEGACHRSSRVGMTEDDEVRVLGEAINHREDDGLAANLRQPLDEVHGDVRPHLGGHVQRLQ